MVSMLYYSLAMWAITSSVATFAQAFVPSNGTNAAHRPRRIIPSLRARGNEPSDGGIGGRVDDDDDDDKGRGENDDDAMILDELRNTKRDMFGADVTADEDLRDAAVDAENALLAAMLEQTQKFKQIKSEEGSERAIEVFMERIQEEDERALRDDGQPVQDDVNEEDEKRPGEVNDENDDTWQ